jgi:tartrate-resistant acid phosphatase type 5
MDDAAPAGRFYACGHNHGLEHLQVDGFFSSFLISGGAGREIRPMIRSQPGPFSRSMYGFVHLQLQADRAVGRFINDSGQEFHCFRRTPGGRVTME